MGREHKNDISMNSAYLETFRRRKNELLASEIDLSEGVGEVSSGFKSANSVYLDTFRKRKNKQLAGELKLHEDKPVRSGDASLAIPRSMIQNQDSSRSALGENAVGKPVKPNFPVNGLNDDNRLPNNTGFNRNNRLNRSAGSFENEVHDNHFAANHQERPGRTRDGANAFAEKSAIANGSGSLQHTGAAKANSKADSAAAKSKSKKGSGAAEAKKDKKTAAKKNAKVAILLSLLIIIVCGFVVFSKMNSDSMIEDVDGNTSQSQGLTYSTVSQRSDTTVTTTTTTTTTESTTESSVETTTTSQSTHYETLSPGSEGDDVLKMQKRLAQLGYISKKSCTGFYGDYTKKMVKMFQEKAGLKQTGSADPETLEKLYSDDAPDCFH